MICGSCNGPVEVKGVGDLPTVLGAPVVVEKNYLDSLVCVGCQKSPKLCKCPEFDWKARK